MRQLPLGAGTCDVALCLWTAFHELLTGHEQLQALREIHGVLRPGGWALFEGPVGRRATAEVPQARARSRRVAAVPVNGLWNRYYQHDLDSLTQLVTAAGITRYRVYAEAWAGRPRQFLWLAKEPGPPSIHTIHKPPA